MDELEGESQGPASRSTPPFSGAPSPVADGPAALRSVLQPILRYLPIIALGNLLVGVPALIISLSLAYFSFVQAEATEKMQIASVWPRVSFVNSNQSFGGESQISLSLVNKGVGPAVIRGMQVTLDGVEYVYLRDLLAACCTNNPEELSLMTGTIYGEVLSSGEEMVFARMLPEPETLDVYQQFNSERLRLEVQTCYCSVFNECWIDSSSDREPLPVDQCPADWVQYAGFPQNGGMEP